MKQITDAAIASPHWEACETCIHNGQDGCDISDEIEIYVYLGDWIICENHNEA